MSDSRSDDVPNPENGDPENGGPESGGAASGGPATGTEPNGGQDENPTSLEGADDEGGTRANEPRSDVPWIKPHAD